MRIVKRTAFAKLPPNTLFSEYYPCVFGPLMIKGDTINDGNDWFEQQIADAIEMADSSERFEALTRAEDTGESLRLDFDCESRNALFEDDNRLYAVWEKQDVEHLVNRLKRCLLPALNQEECKHEDTYEGAGGGWYCRSGCRGWFQIRPDASEPV